MDFGIVDLKIANDSSRKERFPVNTCMKIGNRRDRRIGVSRLIDPQIFQIDGKSNGVEIKFSESDGVALEPGIHISLNPSTQGFIKKISEDKDTY